MCVCVLYMLPSSLLAFSMCRGCFFFKQKTAYEMRISDWSSDVCSSDLRAEIAVETLHEHGISFGEAVRVWIRVALLSFGGPAGQIAVMHRILVEEIGRASCRERVCQYV